MNKNNRLINYTDVVLVPKLSTIESRGTIDVSCKLGNQLFNLPVVPANIKTLINEQLEKSLSDSVLYYAQI